MASLFGNAGNVTRRGALALALFAAATGGATFAPQPAFAQKARQVAASSDGFVFGSDVDAKMNKYKKTVDGNSCLKEVVNNLKKGIADSSTRCNL
jgi:hypothetical protein